MKCFTVAVRLFTLLALGGVSFASDQIPAGPPVTQAEKLERSRETVTAFLRDAGEFMPEKDRGRAKVTGAEPFDGQYQHGILVPVRLGDRHKGELLCRCNMVQGEWRIASWHYKWKLNPREDHPSRAETLKSARVQYAAWVAAQKYDEGEQSLAMAKWDEGAAVVARINRAFLIELPRHALTVIPSRGELKVNINDSEEPVNSSLVPDRR